MEEMFFVCKTSASLEQHSSIQTFRLCLDIVTACVAATFLGAVYRVIS